MTTETPKTLTHDGHTYELVKLSREGAWSLRCTDLAEGEDASDLSWPKDEAVGQLAGVPLRFCDGGDDNAEAIYCETHLTHDELTGTEECAYCGTAGHDAEAVVPAADDVDGWAEIAGGHAPSCEWVTTRAHRLPALATQIGSLDQLVDLMRVRAPVLGDDWSALPTFGGEPVANTDRVWSWDATRKIVGAGADDVKIVPRESL